METQIFTVAAVLALEMVLALGWTGFYYRHGLPLFWRSSACPRDDLPPDLTEALSDEYTRSLTSSLCFRELGPHDIGFRERFFQLSLMNYAPVMRGHISFDERTCTFTVTGRAYAWPFAFAAVCLPHFYGGTATPASEPETLALPLFVMFFFGALYFIQAVRFNRVFHSVRQKVNRHPAS